MDKQADDADLGALSMPDLTIFKNMDTHQDCDGNATDCLILRRIKAGLTYHRLCAAKGAKGQTIFVKFCDGVYTKQALLADYIHLFTKHSDSASKAAIVSDLHCECADIEKCTLTARHLRDRGAKQTERVNFYTDIFDTIHFNLFHLEHVLVQSVPSRVFA